MTRQLPPRPCKCGDPKCFERTATDYELSGMPMGIRMLALLHAAGRDTRDYFDLRVSSTGQVSPKVNHLGDTSHL